MIQKPVQVCSFRWHPEKKILAVGWEGGEVTTWNTQEAEFCERMAVHKSPLHLLQWSMQGGHIVTADKVYIAEPEVPLFKIFRT